MRTGGLMSDSATEGILGGRVVGGGVGGDGRGGVGGGLDTSVGEEVKCIGGIGWDSAVGMTVGGLETGE